MTTDILERIAADGVELSVSEDGELEIIGEESAVDKWMDSIRENKVGILAELNSGFSATVSKTSQKYSELESGVASCDSTVTVTGKPPKPAPALESEKKLSTDSKYSLTVTDDTTDPVIVLVEINGLGSICLEIPKINYDGIALLQVLEEFNNEN